MSTDNPTGFPPSTGDPQPPVDKDKKSAPPEKKVFTLADVKRVVPVTVWWEGLYGDYQPWKFKFRLALSSTMQTKREEWLGLPAGQASEAERYRQEMLDEVCDLLVDYPTGFGDLKEHGQGGQDPGSVFRNYVTAASKDPEGKETIYAIMSAANHTYWVKVTPREFRPPLQDSSS